MIRDMSKLLSDIGGTLWYIMEHYDTLWRYIFNIHTADIPTPTAPVQVMLYADDITITSTHTSMSAARKYIQPYLHKVYDWTQHITTS